MPRLYLKSWPKIRRALFLCGVAAVAAYVVHVVAGGLLWPGYDHLRQPISDLTATGAPDRAALSAVTNLYGLLAIIFAACFFLFFARQHNLLLRIGALLFIGLHLVSLSYGFFPQDLPGQPATSAGVMHIVVTALIVPFTIASPLVIGFGLRRLAGLAGLAGPARFSILCGVLILVFGGLSGAAYANKWEYFGLLERLNIGTLQTWTVVMSLMAWRQAADPKTKEGST